MDIVVKTNKQSGKLKEPIIIYYNKKEQLIEDIGIYAFGKLRVWVYTDDKRVKTLRKT